MKSLLYKPKLQNLYYVSVLGTLSLMTLIYFSNILQPFMLALSFWYIIREVKRQISKINIFGYTIPKSISGSLAFVTITLVILLVVELFSINISAMYEVIPEYTKRLNGVIAEMSDIVNNPQVTEQYKNFLSKLDFGAYIRNLINSLSTFLGDFSIILIYVIFLLLEELVFLKKRDMIFPEKNEKFLKFQGLLRRVDDSLREYIVSKTIISLITGVGSYIVLLIFDVDFALFWSFLIFILNFIPYVGSIIASLLPPLFAVLKTLEPLTFVYVLGSLLIVQGIVGNIIEPRLLGKNLNISPITVLLGLAFWGKIWGVVGMLLAVPILAVAIVLFSQFESTKFIAVILSENGKISTDKTEKIEDYLPDSLDDEE